MTAADPRCNGICMTGAEIGVLGYPGAIAYPHPECEAHGAVEPRVVKRPRPRCPYDGWFKRWDGSAWRCVQEVHSYTYGSWEHR